MNISQSGSRQPLLAPQQTLLGALGIAVLAVALSAYLALLTPWLGIEFKPSPDSWGLDVEAVSPGHPNALRVVPGSTVTGLIDGEGRTLRLHPLITMEEPDVLPSYSRFKTFLDSQDAVSEALNTPPLSLVLASGELVQVTATGRTLFTLPLYFWWQVLIGAACFVIGAGVWAFRRGQVAPQLLLLSGIGVLGFTALAAVYSTRELVLDGDLFRFVSAATHFFTLLHTAALLALIWVYPRRLGKAPVPALIFAAAGLAWLLDSFRVTPSALWSHYLFVNLAFLVGLIFVCGQWCATRGRPVERAIMRWFVLAIFFGSITNILLLKAPLLLGERPFVGQGWVFVTHLLVYAGLALGIVRYRLFDLERWWFKAWLWFFAGVVVVVTDVTLLVLLDLDAAQALGLSLLFVGWLYFPLRQWAWSRLMRGGSDGISSLLAKLTTRLVSAGSAVQIHAEWPKVLRDSFMPLELHPEPKPLMNVVIGDNGTQLRVPGLDHDSSLVLNYPAGGSRLFSPQDVERVEVLLEVARHVAGAAQAREDGARAERERIMRDLHDDLGARLLSLVYVTDSERGQYLARAAIDDLHGILASAHGDSFLLKDAVEDWLAECVSRVEEAGIRADFTSPAGLPKAGEELLLSARVHVNIGRIIREALSNAIRHAHPQRIGGRFEYLDDGLVITISNDGVALDPTQWQSGHGLRTMQTRAHEIGADLQWRTQTTGECQVRLRLPLPEDPGVDSAHISPGTASAAPTIG